MVRVRLFEVESLLHLWWFATNKINLMLYNYFMWAKSTFINLHDPFFSRFTYQATLQSPSFRVLAYTRGSFLAKTSV